jgi:hypothetical protein
MLELNMSIFSTHCDSFGCLNSNKDVLIKDLESFWESEYCRVGDLSIVNITTPIESLQTTNSSIGFNSWVHSGRNEDGWSAAKGISGHLSGDIFECSKNLFPVISQIVQEKDELLQKSTKDKLISIILTQSEPTRSEYLLRAKSCIQYLNSAREEKSKVTRNNNETNQKKYQSDNKSFKSDYGLQSNVSNNTVEKSSKLHGAISNMMTTNQPTASQPTARVDDKKDNQVGGSNEEDGDGDGMVYSRLHGYRIPIMKDDTSLPYKKVLGDIKVYSYINTMNVYIVMYLSMCY